jgi:hypothetical protein
VIVAIVSLLMWRTAPEIRLLTLAGAVVAAFVFVGPNKFFYYAIIYSPAVDLVLAMLVVRCAEAATSASRHSVAPLVLTVVASLFAWRTGSESWIPATICIVVAAVLLALPARFYRPILGSTSAAFLRERFGATPGGLQRSVASLRRATAYAVCCAFAILATVYLLTLRSDFRTGFDAAQASISQYIAPGDRVMGSQTFWFFLYDHTYITWEALPFYERYVPGSSTADAFAEYRPDVMIVDEHVRSFTGPLPREHPYYEALRIPSDEFDEFMRARGSRVASFYNPVHGNVEIYRIRWD